MRYQSLIDAGLADEISIAIMQGSKDGQARLEQWLEHLNTPTNPADPETLRVDTQPITRNAQPSNFNPDEYRRELHMRVIVVVAGFIGLFIILRVLS